MIFIGKPNHIWRAFILVLLFSGTCLAEEAVTRPVAVRPGFGQIRLGPMVDLLRDETRQLTIRDAASPESADRFKPHRAETFSTGLDPAAYWYRFRLNIEPGQAADQGLILAVTRPSIREFDLFLPLKDRPPGQFLHISSGIERVPPPEDLNHRLTAVRLPPGIRSGEFIYARVRTKVGNFSLDLFSPADFERYTRGEYLFFGLLTGVLASMLLYNLIIAVFLKDRIYFLYCLYVAFIGCYVALMTGWPHGLGLSRIYFKTSILELSALTMLLSVVFSKAFLMTRREHPTLDRIMLGLIGICLVILTLSLTGFYDAANTLAYLFGLTGPVIMIGCGVIRWRQGYRPARYFLLAWTALYLATIIYSAAGLGLLGYSFWTANLVIIGAAVETVLLSFALADRIRSLREERAKLKEQERRLTELSITDELTGLYNKRWYSSKLASEVDHARRLGRPLSLLILDVDHFKNFNDAHGHAAGDEVLAELGRIITRTFRKTDIPCRYGGEEFAVVLPDTELEDAVAIAERLRRSFGATRFQISRKERARATISLGVSRMTESDDEASLFERTDKALYQAKESGRNRVVGI